MYNQISLLRGLRKENGSGGRGDGFFMSILIPRFMNGIVNEITSSRCEVIVNEATAMSAFYISNSPIYNINTY